MKPLVLAIAAALLTAGCTPTQTLPPPALPPSYFSTGPYEPQDDAALANWWAGFGDTDLTRLIQTGLDRNHDIRLAVLRLDTARAQLRTTAANAFPTLDAPGQASRQWIDTDVGDTAVGEALGLGDRIRVQTWELALQASWELDLFGATRARIRGAEEQARAAQAQIMATRLGVASTIAQGYIQLRSLQAQRDELRTALDIAETLAHIAQRRFEIGEVTRLDVESTVAEVGALEAQLADVEAGVRESGFALDTLVDMSPGSVERSFGGKPIPHYGGDVAIGQPVDLLRRRPDIIASVAQLDSAEQLAVAARRDLFPSLTVQAALGRSGFALDGNSSASNFGRLGATFNLPFLDFMRRGAAIDIADVEQQSAYVGLRQALANALEEVERAVVRQEGSRRRAAALNRSLDHRERAHRLADRSYQLGEANLADVLDAQRQVIEARQQAVQSRSDLAVAQVALFVALGGGWQPSPDDPDGS